jgi:cysteine-rich repeat protein
VTGHLSEFCGNGILDGSEVCDDGNNVDGDCCGADCSRIAPAGTTCRPAAGDCDVAEACDGTAICPTDGFAPFTTACRLTAGPCDFTEFCTGAGPRCPSDRFQVAGTLCRMSQGPCDLDEVCTGISAPCPTDRFRAAGEVCGAATSCTMAPRCSGTASACGAALPVSCDDNDACTLDRCQAGTGCQHFPMCGGDAGTDARAEAGVEAGTGADAGSDASASVPADGPPPLADATVAVSDTTVSADSQVSPDAPASDGPPGTILPGTDAASVDMGSVTGPSNIGDASPLAEAGAEAAAMATTDGGSTDGAAMAGLDGARDAATDLRLPINNLTGDGCSCRLNSKSSSELSSGESAAWLLPLLAAVAQIALRRRRRPSNARNAQPNCR